jgi:hypothetical protein
MEFLVNEESGLHSSNIECIVMKRLLCGWTGTKIIADVIDRGLVFSCVSRSLAPIVDDIVAEVKDAAAFHIAIYSGTRIPAAMISVEIMMEGQIAIDPKQRPVAVRALVVNGVIQALSNQAPLNSNIRCATTGNRESLISSPTRGAMIDDDFLRRMNPYGILLNALLVTGPDSHVPDDDVVRSLNDNPEVLETNTVAGSSLTSNGEVRFYDCQQ